MVIIITEEVFITDASHSGVTRYMGNQRRTQNAQEEDEFNIHLQSQRSLRKRSDAVKLYEMN